MYNDVAGVPELPGHSEAQSCPTIRGPVSWDDPKDRIASGYRGERLARIPVFVITIWQGCRRSPGVVDAAKVDGAGVWARFRQVYRAVAFSR